MKKEKKVQTARGYLMGSQEVPCYLCGKGKIIMDRNSIICQFKHPLHDKVERELQEYLYIKAIEWLKNLTN